jgi:hypothetical protein
MSLSRGLPIHDVNAITVIRKDYVFRNKVPNVEIPPRQNPNNTQTMNFDQPKHTHQTKNRPETTTMSHDAARTILTFAPKDATDPKNWTTVC